MWNKQEINLGRVKEKSTHIVRFQWLAPLSDDFKVLDIKASCGCTTPSFTRKNTTLSANFVAPRVPAHLRWKKEYTTTKKIELKTTEGDFTLRFKATIYQD